MGGVDSVTPEARPASVELYITKVVKCVLYQAYDDRTHTPTLTPATCGWHYRSDAPHVPSASVCPSCPSPSSGACACAAAIRRAKRTCSACEAFHATT